jgi:hypothetical protein
MAAGGDFAYAGVTGRRPAGTARINGYLARIHKAASVHRVVCRAFFDVANLLAPPSRLFHPAIVARELRVSLRRLPPSPPVETGGPIARARPAA